MSAKLSAFRQQWPIYGAGLFSNSNITISSIIVPLWALYLGVSPWLIGILLGARHLPGLLFAIHGGVLLDRLGARPVMITFAAIAVAVPILFPPLRLGAYRHADRAAIRGLGLGRLGAMGWLWLYLALGDGPACFLPCHPETRFWRATTRPAISRQ